MENEYKICTKCGQNKKLSEFGIKSKKDPTLRAGCKVCAAAKEKEYNEKNKEKRNKASADYWANNPEYFEEFNQNRKLARALGMTYEEYMESIKK